MAKVHDKFVIELAEVIKGYGNDPTVNDPFHLSEFYRFYELPEIAVSANHFKTMIPLETVTSADAVEKIRNEQRWIPCSERLPEEDTDVLITDEDGDIDIAHYEYNQWSEDPIVEWWNHEYRTYAVAWMPLIEPYEVKR